MVEKGDNVRVVVSEFYNENPELDPLYLNNHMCLKDFIGIVMDIYVIPVKSNRCPYLRDRQEDFVTMAKVDAGWFVVELPAAKLEGMRV